MYSVSNILEDHLRHGLPIYPTARFRTQQHRCVSVPLRGPPHGRVLGYRSVTFASDCTHPHGSIPPNGGFRFRQNVSLLSKRNQHDVCGRFGDRHRRRALQSPSESRPLRNTAGGYLPRH